MNFIKVLNPELAQKLINMGFKYTKESINGKDVCSFVESEDVREILSESYTRKDFFVDNKLYF